MQTQRCMLRECCQGDDANTTDVRAAAVVRRRSRSKVDTAAAGWTHAPRRSSAHATCTRRTHRDHALHRQPRPTGSAQSAVSRTHHTASRHLPNPPVPTPRPPRHPRRPAAATTAGGGAGGSRTLPRPNSALCARASAAHWSRNAAPAANGARSGGRLPLSRGPSRSA